MGRGVSSKNKKVVKANDLPVSSPAKKKSKASKIIASPLPESQSSVVSSPAPDFEASTYGKTFRAPRTPSKPKPVEEEVEAEKEGESDEDTTPEILPTEHKLVDLLQSAQSLLLELSKQKYPKTCSVLAKKLIEVLEAAHEQLSVQTSPPAVATLPPSTELQTPPGWSMFEFLTSEGHKARDALNKSNTYATEDTKNQTVHLTKENDRFVCVACFRGGYRPAACVFSNRLGFKGHRKKGVQTNKVATEPCLAPAKFKEFKKVLQKNGTISYQPVCELEYPPESFARFTVPLEENQYANVYLQAEVLHTEDTLRKYKEYKKEMKNATDPQAKKKIPKVPKPAAPRWKMLELDESIQNVKDLNIHAHIAAVIEKKLATCRDLMGAMKKDEVFEEEEEDGDDSDSEED